ncbi:MAG: Rieske 2Fe-2S domain-containing protein [Chloroflexota bacterium]
MNVDELAGRLQQAVTAAFEQAGEQGVAVKDALHGTWLGHALHPALVAAPIGAWTTATVLDLVGARQGADTALGFGILAALPTAASGLVDWSYTEGKPKRLGFAHAALNGTALTCYAGSWLARRSGHRGLGVFLSMTGLSLVGAAGYLGGELSYTLGQGVNRNAWSPEVEQLAPNPSDFVAVVKEDEVREGVLTAAEASLGETKVPLVLMRKGREILALNATCSHLGGPLAEGKLVDEWCVECPWHASRFDFRDGSVCQGPAAYPQPRYETRIANGMVEVRPVASPADTVDRMLASI